LIRKDAYIAELEAARDQRPSASAASGIRTATVNQLIDALVVKATGKADSEIAQIVCEISGNSSAQVSEYPSGVETSLETAKHLNAQVAMDPQSGMVFSHGLADGGQQSCIGPTAEISVASCDLSLDPNAPPMGSTATATVIRIANRFRMNDIYPGGNIPAAAARSVK
jgi:hypothetical protein